jgi:hypothetical protein
MFAQKYTFYPATCPESLYDLEAKSSHGSIFFFKLSLKSMSVIILLHRATSYTSCVKTESGEGTWGQPSPPVLCHSSPYGSPFLSKVAPRSRYLKLTIPCCPVSSPPGQPGLRAHLVPGLLGEKLLPEEPSDQRDSHGDPVPLPELV